MTRQISDRQISRLNHFITGWLGLYFPKKRRTDLERIIISTASELGFHDVDTCIDHLISGRFDSNQKYTIVSRLTIGEKASFEFLKYRILPGLLSSRRGKDQRLRFWSAGCSTGEEPYSLALLLNSLLPDIRDWQITILATDINTRALEWAGHGVYREWSFRGVPEQTRERHFTRTADGQYELPYSIRKMVTFGVLNLADDSYPSLSTNTNAMDIIFCRNVLMYFEPKRQQQVIRGFHRSLMDNGLLFVSPCETSPVFSDYFETVMFSDGSAYKKRTRKATPTGMAHTGLTDAVRPMAPPAPEQGWPPPDPLPEPPATPDMPEQWRQSQEAMAPESHPYEDARMLYLQGNYGEAAEILSRLLESLETDTAVRPLFGRAALLLAQALANQGKIVPALEWTEKVIAIDKLNAELYYLRATIFQEQGAEVSAIASLRQTLYLDKDFVLAHVALGTLTLRHGNPREAGRHFENALALLDACPPDAQIPGADGMTAGRLSEIIASTRVSMKG